MIVLKFVAVLAAIWFTFFLAAFIIAPLVGYRWFDPFILFVPFIGWIIFVVWAIKWSWRMAHRTTDRYWETDLIAGSSQA